MNPPPEGAVEVSPCVNCTSYGIKCHFIPAPRQAGVAPHPATSAENAKLGASSTIPGVTPDGAEGSASMPPPPPDARYSFLDVGLGPRAELLRAFKVEAGAPAPAFFGEEDAIDVRDTGDLLIQVARGQLRSQEQIRELRRMCAS